MKFCPECGAKQRVAAYRGAAASEAAAPGSLSPYYAFGTVAVFALVFTVYGISHHDQREQTPEVPVFQGTVLGQPHMPAAPASGEPAGSTAQPGGASVPLHHSLQASFGAAHRHSAERYAAGRGDLSDESIYLRKGSTSARPDLARSLARARASLGRNSLWPARRAVMTALAEQPGNGEALQIRAELATREQERDALLDNARLCARAEQWACARNNAGHAVTVDASSREARKLLSRALAAHGADSAGSFGPGAYGADGDQ